MKQTNWSRAWENYDNFETNKQMKSLGFDAKQVKLGSEEDEEMIQFQHIKLTTVNMK